MTYSDVQVVVLRSVLAHLSGPGLTSSYGTCDLSNQAPLFSLRAGVVLLIGISLLASDRL